MSEIKCSVIGCEAVSEVTGLCRKHYARARRHNGDTSQTRAVDWGEREKHPSYVTWGGLRRYHKNNMPEEWYSDFWAFARDVGEKPDKKTKARRKDKTKPWSKDNFYWAVPQIPNSQNREERLAFAREHQRRLREDNKDYYKDKYLKAKYGVSLDWYNKKHEEQMGVCAICGKEETAVIHGNRISLAVDHCHDTGVVRGLLCRSCNNAIGAFDHDIVLLMSAISYVDKTFFDQELMDDIASEIRERGKQ